MPRKKAAKKKTASKWMSGGPDEQARIDSARIEMAIAPNDSELFRMEESIQEKLAQTAMDRFIDAVVEYDRYRQAYEEYQGTFGAAAMDANGKARELLAQRVQDAAKEVVG